MHDDRVAGERARHGQKEIQRGGGLRDGAIERIERPRRNLSPTSLAIRRHDSVDDEQGDENACNQSRSFGKQVPGEVACVEDDSSRNRQESDSSTPAEEPSGANVGHHRRILLGVQDDKPEAGKRLRVRLSIDELDFAEPVLEPLLIGTMGHQAEAEEGGQVLQAMTVTLDIDSVPRLREAFERTSAGEGLDVISSYTAFEYQHLHVAATEPGGVIAVSATVRDVGQREGQEVVQLYIGDRFSSAATPVKELRGFSKVALAPGEETTVRFMLSHADLALLDAKGRLVVEPGAFDVMIGASSEDIRLRAAFHLAQEVALPGRIPLTRTSDAVSG